MNERQQQQQQQQLLLRKSIKIFTHLVYTNVYITVITSTHSFVRTLRIRNICNYKRRLCVVLCSVALQHFILFLFCMFVLYFAFFLYVVVAVVVSYLFYARSLYFYIL